MSREIEHPLRDEPDAELADRPDSDFAKCASCGTLRLKEQLDADDECPRCVDRFHLVERFNDFYGFGDAAETSHRKDWNLSYLENYCRVCANVGLADEIRKHIDFYTPKPLSAAGNKPVDCLTQTISGAGGGKT